MNLSSSLLALSMAASLPLLAATPNVIIIMADDQGYQDLGCFGSPKIKTPHIDRVASEGLLFEKAFVEREKWLDGVTTPWARADYERPRTPSFAHTTAEIMFGTRAATGLFGDDKEDGKEGRR